MSKKSILVIGLTTLVAFAGIFIGYKMMDKPERLKVYNPTDINPKLVSPDVKDIYANHKIRDFKLVNQLGDTITEALFKDKIYVTDFFFTTCPSICPKMSTQMQRVQDAFKDDEQVMILSHTVFPETDSVPVLAAYGELYEVDPEKWQLVTGDKKEIYDLARRSYFAIIDEGGNGDEDDFIHTENFVLIDPNKRIRGFYDGTSKEDVDRLIQEIAILEQEFTTDAH